MEHMGKERRIGMSAHDKPIGWKAISDAIAALLLISYLPAMPLW